MMMMLMMDDAQRSARFTEVTLSLSVLTAIFPGEPGLAGFNRANVAQPTVSKHYRSI